MKWYSNMKISTRLIASFLIIALIGAAIGLVGILNLRAVGEADTYLYEKITVPLSELLKVSQSMEQVRAFARDIVLADTEVDIARAEQSIRRNKDTFLVYIARYKTTLVSEEERRLVNEVTTDIEDYDDLLRQMAIMVRQGQPQAAESLMRAQATPLGQAIVVKLDRLAEIKIGQAADAAEQNKDLTKTASTRTSAVIIVALLLSIGLGLFISSTIRKPINILVRAAERIADGDLGVDIDASAGDEIGELAAALKQMATNVNEAMTNIDASSEQVAGGSQQVSSASQELSQGAAEQSKSIEQITASIQQLSAQTQQNAGNANQANLLSNEAKDRAEQGNTKMQGMLKSMDEINDSSANISKIIKVIDEIAFQTNILALNAAVEAARAGQHGKGFAVVAEEVRNLAARSANAAKETTAMIEGSIKKAEAGTKVAHETALSLSKIVEGIAMASKLVNDIAAASNEQASGIAQVNKAIMQVSDVVHQNSATAQEAAAASQELSSQAEMLKDLVSKFRLKGIEAGRHAFDNLNPDVLRVIENQSQDAGKDAAIELGVGAKQAAATRAKITLSDKEFGKY